jgi:DNA polymerase/3'-5' exonuclease PolX
MEHDEERALMKEWVDADTAEVSPPCDTNAAQEWEELLSKDIPEIQTASPYVLDQNELDSLLGFPAVDDSEWAKKLQRQEMWREVDEMAEDYPALQHAIEKIVTLYKLRKGE